MRTVDDLQAMALAIAKEGPSLIYDEHVKDTAAYVWAQLVRLGESSRPASVEEINASLRIVGGTHKALVELGAALLLLDEVLRKYRDLLERPL